jgi:hypothetical protein
MIGNFMEILYSHELYFDSSSKVNILEIQTFLNMNFLYLK